MHENKSEPMRRDVAGYDTGCPKCDGQLAHDAVFCKPRCAKCGLIWIKLDRTMIAVADMDVSHLTNTVEMLHRQAAPRLERNGFQPEEVARIFPIVEELEAEIDRRLQRQRGLEEIMEPRHQPGDARVYCDDCGPVPCFAHQCADDCKACSDGVPG